MTFFNTTSTSGKQLAKYSQNAKSQEIRIMDVFNRFERMSASQCWMKMYTKEPLTSIRRGITNLTKEGKLVKTEFKVQGYYGSAEYVYQVPSLQKTLW